MAEEKVDKLVTVAQLLDYLGVGEESTAIVESLRKTAIERLLRATGITWQNEEQIEVANEAIRVMAWLSFYATRDSAIKVDFLVPYLRGLITQLQHGGEVYGDDT